jgi:pimeloyl-ACP methyl ester carboxylesterase
VSDPRPEQKSEPVRQQTESSRHFDGDLKNTLDRLRVPIVFVPGVMGSRLQLGATRWDPDDGVVMIPDWVSANVLDAARALDIEATPGSVMSAVIHWGPEHARPPTPFNTPHLYGVERGWSGVVQSNYGDILLELEEVFNLRLPVRYCHPVYAFGYDWRRTIRQTGQQLAERVEDILKRESAKRAILVTHSMGGLLARWACKQGLEGKVAGVVHVVQPVNGAVVAYRRFREGLNRDKGAYLFSPGDWCFAEVMGDSWWGYAISMSGMRGPIELLPNHLYKGWLTDAQGHDISGENVYQHYADFAGYGILPNLGPAQVSELAMEQLGDPDAPNARMNERALLTSHGGEHPQMPPGMAKATYDSLVKTREGRVRQRWAEHQERARAAVSGASIVHHYLGEYVHPRTFMLYAAGNKADVDFDWRRPAGQRATLGKKSGDGTVPIASAQALDAAVKNAWREQIRGGVFPPQLPLSIDIGAMNHPDVFGYGSVRDHVIQRVKCLRLL